MKYIIRIIGLLLLLRIPLSAQVTVEVTLEQEQFLRGEALPVGVRIRNHSGQTLHLGGDPAWLTFSVESQDGSVVSKLGDPPVLGQFKLESSQVATKKVDLAPYFALSQPGRYNIVARVQIKQWNGQIASPPKGFDIITGAKLWSQDFGVPLPPGVTNRLPEIRRYILQQANYLRKRIWLYLQLTDQSESRVFKVVPIGPMLGLSQPEHQLDQSSNLHIFYQDGARTFNYTVVNPDGKIIVRQTYEYIGSRPRLQASQDGKVVVAGGMRLVTLNDIPAPKKDEDAPNPPKH